MAIDGRLLPAYPCSYRLLSSDYHMGKVVAYNQAIGANVMFAIVFGLTVIIFTVLIFNYAFRRKRREADKAL